MNVKLATLFLASLLAPVLSAGATVPAGTPELRGAWDGLPFTLRPVDRAMEADAFAGSPFPGPASPAASADSDAPRNSVLADAACVSDAECWAVGYHASFDAQTLVERWDGSAWTIVTSPNVVPATTYNVLRGVACASPTDCWAVGFASDGTTARTLVERWDGSSWTITSSPNVGTFSVLRDVTCVSTTRCWAVGYSVNEVGQAQTLTQRWDGAAWSVVSSPSTSPLQNNYLLGVSCPSASDCWAVGYVIVQNVPAMTLIERWDGTSWSVTLSPNTSPLHDNVLKSVTCASSSDCWAVGDFAPLGVGTPFGTLGVNRVHQTLIERWDGTSWTVASSANSGPSQHNLLEGVHCASPTQCWAVGYHTNDAGYLSTLIERWDGSAWTLSPSPDRSVPQNILTAATCARATGCWAVGYYLQGGIGTLIERWNGSSWELVPSPNASL